MFKSLGNFIFRTPWWAIVLFGLTVLASLVLFATPVHVLRLQDSGQTPAENEAIKREIRIAFGDSALNVAEEVVSAMKRREGDAERNSEFDRALAEIARARKELSQVNIGGDAAEAARDAAQEARQNALEIARDAAEAALNTAVDARESIEESRTETLEKLRNKGVDIGPTAASLDELLKSAQANEVKARSSLESVEKLLNAPPPATAPPLRPAKSESAASPKAPVSPSPPELPQAASSAAKGGLVTIKIDTDGKLPGLQLPPEFRGTIHNKVASDFWRIGVGSVLILTFIPLFIVLLIAKFFIGRSRWALEFAHAKERQAVVSDSQRQVTEARLQALQAQVEPHFLYNTLANVQALTEVDPPAANQMVGHLIQYLRSALPKMRESTSSVGQEIELVRAYLNILKMRMGQRLSFSIDVPDDLLSQSFPPLMLPSLVENAIKHGLEPVREGGHIAVVVSRVLDAEVERICVKVSDNGKGLSDTPVQTGGGVGLSNLRERLKAIYGDRASFTLESNTPRGVVASLCIPPETPVALAEATQEAPDFIANRPFSATPPTGWSKVRDFTSKTHSAWSRVLARVFMSLMVVLLALLAVAFVALYTGWLPIMFGDVQVEGLEGMAMGSVGLLVGFGITVLAVAILVAVLYGLGWLIAGLLILIPAIALIANLPLLAFLLGIGLVGYMLWKRRNPS